MLLLLPVFPVQAQFVCHDDLWPDEEFCGRDAYVVTGFAEMNHDCIVDYLDIAIFFRAMDLSGSNLSADLNDDNVVNHSDLIMFVGSIGMDVSPCNPWPAIPDACAGALALSTDPDAIISRTRVAAGGFLFVQVVASGWQDALAVEYAVETSSNLTFIADSSAPGWANLAGEASGNRRYYVRGGMDSPISAPTAIMRLDFSVTDDQPAWIKLVEYDTPNDKLVRWAPDTLDRRSEFSLRRHLGINGLDPVSETACPAANTSPNVAITVPAFDIPVSYATTSYVVSGNAVDPDGSIGLVEYRVNDGDWQVATGTTAWSFTTGLVVGENWIQVRGYDNEGATSSTQVVSIFRVLPDLTLSDWLAPDTISTGCGGVDVTVTCVNSGGDADPCRLGFYLSEDSIIQTTDHLVGAVDLEALLAGRDTTVTTTLVISDSNPPGAIYLGAYVDDLDVVVEQIETNNNISGALELPIPAVTEVVDVAYDQGRAVRINVLASSRDALGSSTPVLQYEVFRRIDPLPTPLKTVATPTVVGAQISSPAKLAGWEFAGSIPAHGELEYNLIAPTLADSSVLGIHYSVFFVRAATAVPLVFFDSCPDSGWSVDNLPPSVPAGLKVAYSGVAGNGLSWESCPDEDFRYFRIYRSTAPGFTPGPENLITATVDTEWTDDTENAWDYYYKLTAVDHAGNESAATDPDEVSGAGDTPALPTRYWLDQNVPNPFNPSTLIGFDQPRAAFVTLDIFAADGRLVTSLISEFRPAGHHEAIWQGEDRQGRRVAAGVYFYRLRADEFNATKSMLLVK